MNVTATSASARVRTVDGKLYEANVRLEAPWAHLTDARRLTRHGEEFAVAAAGDLTLRAQDVVWIRWADGSAGPEHARRAA